MIKIITASITTTINTPTPTPALKIPSITEQLENKKRRMKTDNDFNKIDFIIFRFN